MVNNQHVTDFDLLQTAANYIKPELENELRMWSNSPFNWIIRLPSGTKGKLGKKLISQWCALKGLAVDRSPDSEADMLINGYRIEVKFSTLWQKGIYKFQQLRDQNYDFCICLGISPFLAHCWVIDKKILLQNVIGHLGQHTGVSGKDTAWFTVNPNNPPGWLIGCGGSLNEAYRKLNSLARRR